MKIGYSTWGMPLEDVAKAIPRLAAMGYRGIEFTVLKEYSTSLETLDAGRRSQIRDLLGAHGLELAAIAAHSSLAHSDPALHAANMWRLEGAVRLAAELDPESPPPINTTTGGRPEEWDALKGLLVERLGRFCEFAGSMGVKVALEPHVGGALDLPGKTLWLLDRVGSPHLKVNCDYSHFLAQGLSPEETVPQLAPHSVHTHVKGVHGVTPDFQFVTPGEDDFDYANYFRVIENAGYRGFHTLEVSKHVQARPGYEPFSHAQLGYDTLTRAYAAAGLKS